MENSEQRIRQANRVTWIGLFFNLILSLLKLVAGIMSSSSAMVADAIHSISDLASDLVILCSFRVVKKPIDESHDYGHGKYETIATLILSLMLLLVGGWILYSGIIKIIVSIRGTHLEAPGMLAFWAAVVSIICKEALYRYTLAIGKRIKSQALIANAWHHRSDAFSSIGTALGIGGAIFLGHHWTVLDPIAAIIVSAFIIKIGFSILYDSMHDLSDGSLNEETERQIYQLASRVDGVLNPHQLRTRRIGNSIAMDIHINVNSALNITQAHHIATRLEESIRAEYGRDTFISVHIEPDLELDETM
ncbi:MAG: cation transporter [Candidatus Delongbacteria bacterium]|nr:cation transporter [Candidatus Delongbacteria bacterium]